MHGNCDTNNGHIDGSGTMEPFNNKYKAFHYRANIRTLDRNKNTRCYLNIYSVFVFYPLRNPHKEPDAHTLESRTIELNTAGGYRHVHACERFCSTV